MFIFSIENHEVLGPPTKNCPKLDKNKSIQGVPKKGVNEKLLVGAVHNFNSQFLNLFGFCKFCLVYHLKDLGAPK